MIRVDRKELTRSEIIRCAAHFFMKEGYSNTTFRAMGKALNMSTGNMTFYFKTKEHLLAELVDMLARFQWKRIEEEMKEGYSAVMAICLELLIIASVCEQDEVAKDFFISVYTSPICLDIIRKNDIERAKEVFKEYCPDWTDEQFAEAENLVSGIEYTTLQVTESSAPLETRVRGALDLILTIYGVSEEMRKQKIEKVLSMDYETLGMQVLNSFREYLDNETEQTLHNLLARRQVTEG